MFRRQRSTPVERVVVIGDSLTGLFTAAALAGQGRHVTVVERDGMGGACVIDDCVPSKTFIASAGIRVEMRRADELGVQVDRHALGERGTKARSGEPQHGIAGGLVGDRGDPVERCGETAGKTPAAARLQSEPAARAGADKGEVSDNRDARPVG